MKKNVITKIKILNEINRKIGTQRGLMIWFLNVHQKNLQKEIEAYEKGKVLTRFKGLNMLKNNRMNSLCLSV